MSIWQFLFSNTYIEMMHEIVHTRVTFHWEDHDFITSHPSPSFPYFMKHTQWVSETSCRLDQRGWYPIASMLFLREKVHRLVCGEENSTVSVIHAFDQCMSCFPRTVRLNVPTAYNLRERPPLLSDHSRLPLTVLRWHNLGNIKWVDQWLKCIVLRPYLRRRVDQWDAIPWSPRWPLGVKRERLHWVFKALAKRWCTLYEEDSSKVNTSQWTE